MMIGMANGNLSAAKKAKKDEFYTQYADIEKEMNAYLDYDPHVFRDKTVLLPCDDPEWSNFTKYFAQNFEHFGMKKLISTSYAYDSKNLDTPWQPTLFETESPRYDKVKSPAKGKIFTLDRNDSAGEKLDVEHLQWRYLKGDGDFRSIEIQPLIHEADFVITNPPFSMFREFLAWVVSANKRFSVIGNMNAITYKEVFPLIRDNRIWTGATNFNTGMYFEVPENFSYKATYKFKREMDGVKVNRVPGVCWYTDVEHGRRHQPLSLMNTNDNLRFNKKFVKTLGDDVTEYQHYDNYDAIEVPYTDAIPDDYQGVMGVPISFLDKYNPNQFEILGATQRGCHDAVPDTKRYDSYWEMKQDGTATGSSGSKTNENANLKGNDGRKNYFVNKDGDVVQSAYQRIFIRKK